MIKISKKLYLEDKIEYINIKLEDDSKIYEDYKVYKSYEDLVNSLIIKINDMVYETYNSQLDKKSSDYILGKIDNSIKNSLIHYSKLRLEDGRTISIFKSLKKEKILLIDSLDKEFIESIIDVYDPRLAYGSLEIYKLLELDLYNIKFEEEVTSKKSLNLKLEYGGQAILFNNLDILSKGQIIIDYDINNGSIDASLNNLAPSKEELPTNENLTDKPNIDLDSNDIRSIIENQLLA